MTGTTAAPYPPAPWHLSGASIQTLCLVRSSDARRLVPRGLRIVPVLPGRTLGVLYCASYEPPSLLRYHELILAPAFVAAGGRAGFWISNIYVDDAVSELGGRGIWGLPKVSASFEWDAERREVAVQSGSQPLCRIAWTSGAARLPAPLYLPVISRRGADYGFFSGTGSARVGWSRGEIAIDAGSPLARIGFEGMRSVLVARGLRLRVAAPRVIR